MKRLIVVVMFVAAACGGGKKEGTGPTQPAAPDAAPAAPTGVLTPAECEQAIDHIAALYEAHPEGAEAAQQIREQRAGLVEEYVKTGTREDYECLVAAKTADEVGNCGAK
jgi:hypothetical protein